jgi:hypothetical protein
MTLQAQTEAVKKHKLVHHHPDARRVLSSCCTHVGSWLHLQGAKAAHRATGNEQRILIYKAPT